MIFTAHYPVYIGDTDAGGIVYHANHLNFLERCRRDWLKSLGFASYFLADGVHLVVKKADIGYHRPLLLDELLTVSIEKVATKKASLSLTQHIYQEGQDRPATTAIIVLACVAQQNGRLSPTPLPSCLVYALKS